MKRPFFGALAFRPIISIPVSLLVWLLVAPVLLILAIAPFLAAQDSSSATTGVKRAITEKDLFNFVWVADPQVAPDGCVPVHPGRHRREAHRIRDFNLDRLDGGQRSACAPYQRQA